jgi:Mg/Co/Ni transporter MgtE
LLQSDQACPFADVCDRNPVRVGPGTDVTDVAVLMNDYNLTTIPVVEPRGRMLGLITVDDVLEVTLPENWRRREVGVFPSLYQPGNQAADDAGEQL